MNYKLAIILGADCLMNLETRQSSIVYHTFDFVIDMSYHYRQSTEA